MPKRYSDGRACRKSKRRRRYLYLVMKDGLDGYAIRKFDLWMDSHGDNEGTVVQRLPPTIFRFQGFSRFFAAIGKKIMAMHSDDPIHVIPVFDVRTKCLTLGPWWQNSFIHQPACFAVGDKLVILDKGCAGLLYPPSVRGEWAWLKLPDHFFMLQHITSYAVHPDGKTIFISIDTATFSLDTESNDSEWRSHGQWRLPFTGYGHFDPGLNAWVGLSGDSATRGYLRSCDVVPTDPDPCTSREPPACKLSKKKLFCDNLAEEHIGANLVYMGVEGFCLVQYFSIEADTTDKDAASSSDEMDGASSSDEMDMEELRLCQYWLRLTKFSLKYDNGDLCTETPCRVMCYQLPRASNILRFDDPPAFWM